MKLVHLIRHTLTLLAFIFCPFVSVVSANGVNPARPSSGTVLQATCLSKSTGEEIVLFRASLSSNKSKDNIISNDNILPFKLPRLGEVNARLVDIRELKIKDAKTDSADWINVETVLLTPAFEGDASIRLGSKESPIVLRGFDASRSLKTVPLSDCSVVTIAKSEVSNPDSNSGSKK